MNRSLAVPDSLFSWKSRESREREDPNRPSPFLDHTILKPCVTLSFGDTRLTSEYLNIYRLEELFGVSEWL